MINENDYYELFQKVNLKKIANSKNIKNKNNAKTITEIDKLNLKDRLSNFGLSSKTNRYAFLNLDLSYLGFEVITKLEYFNLIETLNLSNNKFIEIPNINKLEFLLTLDLSNNYINNISNNIELF